MYSHELRTPIQPILGLTQVIRSESKDAKQSQLLYITVTKIESSSLQLKNNMKLELASKSKEEDIY